MQTDDQLIVPAMWDEAKWKGVAFGYEPDTTPWMALAFANREPAARIFEFIRSKTGPVDSAELLRVSIIEGDIPGEEAGYTVHLTTNFDAIEWPKDAQQPVFSISRIHRMNPAPGSNHLAGFKERFAIERRYKLLPATLTDAGRLDVAPGLMIEKTSVIFRHVSGIGRDDIDRAIFVREDFGSKH